MKKLTIENLAIFAANKVKCHAMGEHVVPADVLWGSSIEEEQEYLIYGKIPEYWKFNIDLLNHDYRVVEYRAINKLLSWHFDVIGLIKEGLAIDKNTIKS